MQSCSRWRRVFSSHGITDGQSGERQFWNYRLYSNENGGQVQSHYCTDFQEAEAVAKKFLDTQVLGFDLEWNQLNSYGNEENIKNKVSTIQIASEDRVAVFHIALFQGVDSGGLLPPTLRVILESGDIIKTGVSVLNDARRLHKYFDLEMHGVFELSRLYRLIKYSETDPLQVNKKLVSLASQVEDMLGLPLDKDPYVRSGDWSKLLNDREYLYAASDAYAGMQLYKIMETKRRGMQPIPSLPTFVEVKPTAKRRAAGEAGPDETSSKGNDPLLPDSVQPFNTELIAHEPPEMICAKRWVLDYLGVQDQKGRHANTSMRYLEAYALWHIQGHGIARTARLMAFNRIRPLSKLTVAMYIVRIVRQESLECNSERLREAREIVREFEQRKSVVLVSRTF